MFPYVDDVNAVGTTASEVNRDREKAATELAAANLKTDPAKNFSDDDQPYKEAIGFDWFKEGILTVKPADALRLFRSTNRILVTRRASPSQIRQVLGLWTYAILFSGLRPPFFARISDSSKKQIRTNKDGFPIRSSRSLVRCLTSFRSC